ncbi:MAG: hypothetical protein QXM55_03540 [Ignisphaera sp.]
MRIWFWMGVAIVSVVLAFSTIIFRYSALDFIATAMLLFISIYVTLRFILSIYFGIELKPMVYVGFKYLNLAVLSGLTATVLNIAIDSILSLIYTRGLQTVVLSIIITTTALYTTNRFFKLKGLIFLLTFSVFITSVLYILGYIKEMALSIT